MKTLVLGLGNPIVTDDAVGLRVAQALKPLLTHCPDIDISEDHWGGLRLMERMVGYNRAIIIDAICTGSLPGTIHHLMPWYNTKPCLPPTTPNDNRSISTNSPARIEFDTTNGSFRRLIRFIRFRIGRL